MLEITSILVLTSSFIDELGTAIAYGLDLVIRTTAGAVRGLDLSELKMKNIQNMKDVLLNADGLEKLTNLSLEMLQGLNKPLLVHTRLFVAFVAAALLFYYLSTILCKDNSGCQRRPWVTRWSAAVGGPLHLLGCVEEPEVRKLCQYDISSCCEDFCSAASWAPSWCAPTGSMPSCPLPWSSTASRAGCLGSWRGSPCGRCTSSLGCWPSTALKRTS